jgi:hypothetical protein
VVTYFEHEALIRCDIGPKTIERFGNEFMNLQLIINTCITFIGLQLSKGLYIRRNVSFRTWTTNQMQHLTEIGGKI